MKTKTSSLMDGKNYTKRNFVFSDDHIVKVNKMVSSISQLLEEKPRHIYTIQRYLNVSERTTYRYIECFKAIGYTVIKGKDLRYGLKKDCIFTTCN